MNSMRKPRWTTTAAVVPLIVATVMAGATWASGPKYASKWDEGHDPNESVARDRPECPQHWGTIPLFLDRAGVDRLRRAPGARSRTPGLVIQGNDVSFQPTGAWAPGVPSGPIANVAGSRRDIPEYHDCQKFVNGEQTRFDSLFAIFASFRLDSIVNAFTWDQVTWSSSSAVVATVDASGRVTAVSAGNTTIVATSIIEPSRKRALAVTVLPNQPPPPHDTVGASIGAIALSIGHSIQVVAEVGTPTVTTNSAAAIYSYGPGYPRLGIGPNFNCLYLYVDGSGSLRAKVSPVDVANLADACLSAKDPKAEAGTELRVIRIPGGQPTQHPEVARWDWDSKNKQQYIGIKCGDAWCEVGPSATAFTPSPGHRASPSAPPGVARVIENKGWYDEQNLAMPGSDADPSRPGKKRLVPSGIIGTVIPDPDLAANDSAAYATGDTQSAGTGTWVPVGYIALDTTRAAPGAVSYYRETLRLNPASLGGDLSSMNRFAYCFGTRAHCRVPDPTPPVSANCGPAKSLFGLENNWLGTPIERMWLRITSAGSANPVYRCVTRRGHLDVNGKPPATARWRWLLLDDTTWTECAKGCCEYRPV